MTTSDQRPWRSMYPAPLAEEVIAPEHSSALAAFRDQSRQRPAAPMVTYFDRTLTAAELDRHSDALAAKLEQHQIRHGDRVGLHMQNMPQFVIALLAIWKIGAILVPLNPMLRTRELEYQLSDSGAVALITLDTLWEQAGRDAAAGTAVKLVITASAVDLQSRNDARLFAGGRRAVIPDAEDSAALLTAGAGSRPVPREPALDDVAFLCYTSGTTGPPTGAVSSHRNVITLAQVIRDFTELNDGSRILGLAPLFHITGLMVQLIPALITGVPIVLSYRYQPGVMLDAILEYQPTFAVGPITAFIGLLQDPGCTREHFQSFDRIHSGGGETVKAYVSLNAGAAVAPGELIAFAGERLAPYKRPRLLDILPDLPKTSSGKILRRLLKDDGPPLPAAGPGPGAPAAD